MAALIHKNRINAFRDVRCLFKRPITHVPAWRTIPISGQQQINIGLVTNS